jgi:hypothetical protein
LAVLAIGWRFGCERRRRSHGGTASNRSEV